MARRRRGTGAAYFDKVAGRWIAAVSLGTVNGLTRALNVRSQGRR